MRNRITYMRNEIGNAYSVIYGARSGVNVIFWGYATFFFLKKVYIIKPLHPSFQDVKKLLNSGKKNTLAAIKY